MPEKFENVTVVCKANIFFDGGVMSHVVLFNDGTKKSLGLIRPGTYKFNTELAEKMEMTGGNCRVKHAGRDDWQAYAAGSAFDVAANSYFEIAVDEGIAEYVCSFIK